MTQVKDFRQDGRIPQNIEKSKLGINNDTLRNVTILAKVLHIHLIF